MNQENLVKLLERYKHNEIQLHEIVEKLAILPYADLNFAKPDLDRSIRQGFAETIFCPGKTAQQIVAIANELAKSEQLVLASKADKNLANEVLALSPGAKYIAEALVIYWGQFPPLKHSHKISPTLDSKAMSKLDKDCTKSLLPKSSSELANQCPKTFTVGLITAGTSDISVSEEAFVFLQALGINTVKFYDIGVAGLSRLLSNLEEIRLCQVIIAVCGMDAALASVIAGLVACPIIAIPTSVGYGANFTGVAALLSMLNSCANGLTVVNIDNGYGAALATYRIFNKFYN